EATSLDDGLLSLTLRGCTLTGSLYGLTAVATGTSSLDLTITGSAITHNRAGGVRFVAVGRPSSDLVVSDSTLAGNSIPRGSGGGLIADGSSSVLMHVLVSNVTFDRNRVRYRYAGGQGGGLAVIGLVDAEVSASQVTRNKANNLGGGLWGDAHGVSITNSVFVQNAGAAIYLSRRAFTSPSSWSLSDSTVTKNQGTVSTIRFAAGGIFVSGGTLDIQSSIVWGNHSFGAD